MIFFKKLDLTNNNKIDVSLDCFGSYRFVYISKCNYQSKQGDNESGYSLSGITTLVRIWDFGIVFKYYHFRKYLLLSNDMTYVRMI